MSINLRLFLAQFRGAWKLRARFTDFRVSLSHYRFQVRRWAGDEIDSSAAILHITRLTLIDFAVGIALALLLWLATPAIGALSVRVNDAAYIQLLGTIAAVGGILIGLYYAAVTAAMTAVYAHLPGAVRQLLMKERYGSTYLRFVAILTFLSLSLLAMRALGIAVTAAALPLLALLFGVAVFGFVKLGAWAFRLFDPTAASHSLFRDLRRLLKQVAVGGYQWRNEAFQRSSQGQGAYALRTLEQLAAACQASEQLRDEALARLAGGALTVAEHSLAARQHIPTTSHWFLETFVQQDWYRSPDHETSIAYSTGTLLRPRPSRDHWWMEQGCSAVATEALRSFLDRREDSLARSLLSAFESYVGTLAQHGQMAEASRVISNLQETIVSTVLERSDTDETQLLGRVALTDTIGRLWVICLLRAADWADARQRKALDQALRNVDWQDHRVPHSLGLPAYLLPRAEWLQERLTYERMVAGRFVTPRWYQAELLAQEEAAALSSAVRALFRDASDQMDVAVRRLRDGNAQWPAACALSASLHYARKAQVHLRRFREAETRIGEGRRIAKLPWQTSDFAAIEEGLGAMFVGITETMAQILPLLPPRPDVLPDYPGQFLHTCGEEVFESVAAGYSARVERVFPALFAGCLAKYDALKPVDLKPDDPWLDADLSVAFAPILDLMELSGISYLLSEAYPSRRTWPVIQGTWDAYLDDHPELTAPLLSILRFDKGLFAITPRSVLRTTWHQRVDHELRQLPTKIEGRGWSSHEVVDHQSDLVRAVVTVGLPGGMYDGLDIFAACYLSENRGSEPAQLHQFAANLLRLLARHRSARAEEQNPGESSDA